MDKNKNAKLSGSKSRTTTEQTPKAPPVHPKVDKRMSEHSQERLDPYHWMNQRDSPEVLEAIAAENSYFQKHYCDFSEIHNELFEKMKSRVADREDGCPIQLKKYSYFERYLPEKQYPQLMRKGPGDKEELLLDFDALGSTHSYFDVGSWKINDDESVLIYSVDTLGRRFYDLHFFDLNKKSPIPFVIKDVTSNFVFSKKSGEIFYTKQDPKTLRTYQVIHCDFAKQANSVIFEETDERFWVGVSRGTSPNFVFIDSDSTMTSEVWFADMDQPHEPQLFVAREPGHEYGVCDGGDYFYILSNRSAKNFSLFKAKKDQHDLQSWQEVISGDSQILLQRVVSFANFLAISQRANGLEQILILNPVSGEKFVIEAQDPAYSMNIDFNFDFNATKLRYNYQSMNTPYQVLEIDAHSKSRELLWQKVVPNFDAQKYEVQRIWVRARDGAEIPVSILTKRGFIADASQPLLLYGYGSYGLSRNPTFAVSRLSLIDRGWSFALAHIRGGSEMGRHWYEHGRQNKKLNTFYDFIDVSRELIEKKYVHPKKLCAMGGSAGGLLMGAVMNMAPELYKSVLAGVPFVDVLSTMMDASLPLTVGEYEEWGDPNDPEVYAYMAKYSPYDNLKKQDYPALFVTSGYHDSQVQYWEPLKWVARLREFNTSGTPVLLHMNVEAGHGGATGRYGALKEIAEEYAFLIWRENQ